MVDLSSADVGGAWTGAGATWADAGGAWTGAGATWADVHVGGAWA